MSEDTIHGQQSAVANHDPTLAMLAPSTELVCFIEVIGRAIAEKWLQHETGRVLTKNNDVGSLHTKVE